MNIHDQAVQAVHKQMLARGNVERRIEGGRRTIYVNAVKDGQQGNHRDPDTEWEVRSESDHDARTLLTTRHAFAAARKFVAVVGPERVFSRKENPNVPAWGLIAGAAGLIGLVYMFAKSSSAQAQTTQALPSATAVPAVATITPASTGQIIDAKIGDLINVVVPGSNANSWTVAAAPTGVLAANGSPTMPPPSSGIMTVTYPMRVVGNGKTVLTMTPAITSAVAQSVTFSVTIVST
jgi:hypothetical protein